MAGRFQIAGGIHGLRQVDDHRTVRREQDVVFGQVAVNHAGAQHAHHLVEQQRMQFECACFGHFHIVQTRRDVAVRIGHQFHQQDAVRADEGLRHAHAGVGELEQRIDFRVLPRLFLHFAAIAAAFFHRALLAAVLDLATLLIGRGLAETALFGVFIDLRAARGLAAADHVDGGFLAAHQLRDDFVDQALFDEREQTFRCFHAATGARWGADRPVCGRLRGEVVRDSDHAGL